LPFAIYLAIGLYKIVIPQQIKEVNHTSPTCKLISRFFFLFLERMKLNTSDLFNRLSLYARMMMMMMILKIYMETSKAVRFYAQSRCFAVLFAGDTSLIPLRVTFSMIGKLGISGAFGVVCLYTPEIFPTTLRSQHPPIYCLKNVQSFIF